MHNLLINRFLIFFKKIFNLHNNLKFVFNYKLEFVSINKYEFAFEDKFEVVKKNPWKNFTIKPTIK